jgi:hypothetical protein
MVSSNKVLHVVQGGVDNGDKASLEKSGERGFKVDRWMVPKSAAVGDDLMIYIMGHGLFATATVAGPTSKRKDWANRYGAAISSLRLINPPISMDVIQRDVPDWAWTRYPRSITTPDPDVALKLRALVENQARSLGPASSDSARSGRSDQEAAVGEASAIASHPYAQDLAAELAILGDAALTVTEQEALVKARRGQGLFRLTVLGVEPKCRITGVDDPDYLIASHIKPWSESSNAERLSGDNGLMLAPHVDHLFDRGYISFTDFGDLLVSPKCAAAVFGAWGISKDCNVGPFRLGQRPFLAYHRAHVFQAGDVG